MNAAPAVPVLSPLLDVLDVVDAEEQALLPLEEEIKPLAGQLSN